MPAIYTGTGDGDGVVDDIICTSFSGGQFRIICTI